MKKTKIFLTLLILFKLQSCIQINKGNDIKKNTQMLHAFYNSYLLEYGKDENDTEEKLNLIRKQYMSPELVHKLKNLNLDFDPVINGQDLDKNWEKKIRIDYLSYENQYRFCLTNKYENKSYCSYLKLKKVNGEYKIYDIQVNDIASILASHGLSSETIRLTKKSNLSSGHHWKTKCYNKAPSFYINDDFGQLEFYTRQNNLVSISTIIEETKGIFTIKYSFLTGISGGNNDLDWNNLSTSKKIAKVKVIDSAHLEFEWFGFYNLKTR